MLPQHTDHAGVMWHGSYTAFLEEARINALARVGLSYSEISALGYEMPVVSMRIDYLKPLRHGEKFTLHSWLLARKGIRLPWKINFLKNGLTT